MRHRSLVLLLLIPLLVSAGSPEDRIRELEDELRKHPGYRFEIHNELRHLYSDIDPKRSLHHSDVILEHSPMHGYILDILAGWEKDPVRASERLLEWPRTYPEFPFVAAACQLRAGDVLKNSDPARSRSFYQQVARSKGAELETYRTMAEVRLASARRSVSVTPPPWKVPVLELRYFPLAADGKNLDLSVTSNVDAPLGEVRARCDRMTLETIQALEQGSRFRAYKNPAAKPSLDYYVVDTLEYLEPVPHDPDKALRADYGAILKRAGLRKYIQEKGVKEVWIWGYHSPELHPWESNFSSVHGDLSNSDRDEGDLPLFAPSYTVYHYNYQRETDMAVHNHIHQIEALMRHHGGELWRRFEGEPGKWRSGNCHFPPNGRHDYDYANKEYVQSDIEDWKPEGFGKKQLLNCDRWGGDDLRWYVYWMQSIPGQANRLVYQGRPLTNWWVFLGDHDAAVAAGVGTVVLSRPAR
ncbi:MAG: hypothetical protein HY319_07290 [Armatimonadetes bacterium]|nr:hypothetical protein [Armatimonadota bacterium]